MSKVEGNQVDNDCSAVDNSPSPIKTSTTVSPNTTFYHRKGSWTISMGGKKSNALVVASSGSKASNDDASVFTPCYWKLEKTFEGNNDTAAYTLKYYSSSYSLWSKERLEISSIEPLGYESNDTSHKKYRWKVSGTNANDESLSWIMAVHKTADVDSWSTAWPPELLVNSSNTTTNTSSGGDGSTTPVKVVPEQIVFNKYRVVKDLGSGATSVVKLGELIDDNNNESQQQLVALKMCTKSVLMKMRSIERVGRGMKVVTEWEKVQGEVAIMKKLQHDQILKLHEALLDEEEGKLIFVLEYCEHGQLMNWNKTERRYVYNNSNTLCNQNDCAIDEEQCRYLFRQMLQGISYLHQNKITHRDIKPENLLLHPSSGIKICDFGVAHIFDNTATANDKQEGFLKKTAGTHAFMPPESLSGIPFSLYQADVWALGLTLHAMLTTHLPFFDSDLDKMFDNIENNELAGHPLLSAGASELLQGMLEKDPEARLTISDIQSHPWVTKDGVLEPVKVVIASGAALPLQCTAEERAAAFTSVNGMRMLTKMKLMTNKWKQRAKSRIFDSPLLHNDDELSVEARRDRSSSSLSFVSSNIILSPEA